MTRSMSTWRRAGRWQQVLALGAALALAQPSKAADDPTQLSLEQLLDLDVQSASKFIQKASEAPSSVTVIGAAEIRRYGYRTLADILNSVRGLSIHYDRNYAYLGVRGFGPLGSYNSRILVMIDGYRLNDPVYGQGSIGREFPLDVDLIERVEFVPGPGSAIYGSNAFFGVVNVITRDGRGLDAVEASAEAGSWRTGKGRVSLGRRFGDDLDVLVSATGYSSQGRDQHYPEFAVPGVSDGVARGLDDERARDFFAKASWRGFTLEAAQGVRDKGVPTASFGSLFGDPRERTEDRETFAELRYDGSLARDLELSARVNRGSYDYHGTYPYDAGGPVVLNIDRAVTDWWGGELKLLSRAFEGHKLVLGTEVTNNTRQDQTNIDLSPPMTYLDERHRSRQWGLYVQDEFALRPDVTLNAGVRHDRYSTFGGITNPRVALIWTASSALTLKALYGRAYRAPTDNELFFSSEPLGWKANPALGPERIATTELTAEWRLASLTRATLGAFHYRISELIELVTDPADGLQTYRNGGNADVTGVQAEIERLWQNGSALRASVSMQRAEDQAGARLVNAPRHVAKLDGAVPLAGERLRAGLALRLLGDRLTRNRAVAGGTTVADLTLTSDALAPGTELSASVYNLTDRRYSDPVSDAHLQDSIRQDGRSFRVKFTVRF